MKTLAGNNAVFIFPRDNVKCKSKSQVIFEHQEDDYESLMQTSVDANWNADGSE